MHCNNNVITIKMPVKKEYSQVLRLTASGACNQAGFDLDVIEDIRVVVSEVLNCLLEAGSAQFEVSFTIENEKV
ncbi:MAG: serine/threonine protein kinase, partial [Clostridia bacterium]|nr:serine/threonine protein kinase [Clostridia bacterium]